MRLKIMEWNIHQQGRQYENGKIGDCEIPLWILREIPDKVDIVVFTEFNCHAKNIQEFYNGLIENGFSYSTTKHSCPWSNDILIAACSDKIVVKEVSYVKAYPDTANTSFKIDWDAIPENLRVDINVSKTDIHLWGIRIKDLKCNYRNRKKEMETVMEWLKEVAGINVLVGDFNNLREDTIEKNWNLGVLDNLIGKEYERKTPKNHSWGVSQNKNNDFDGYIKNDHIIHSKEISVSVENYNWSYLNNSHYSKELEGNKSHIVIPAGKPDHGILIGECLIFSFKDYIAIGEYFTNGGETYTLTELLSKIKNDLGYDQETGGILIGNCVSQGWIIDCGDGNYTR